MFAEMVQEFDGDVDELLGRLVEEKIAICLITLGEDDAIYLFNDGSYWGTSWGIMSQSDAMEASTEFLMAKRNALPTP